ncbi:YhbY family RNA-binding protein [Lactobacillus sp. DCY120]|uniref:YhbY family RNA-binding protein n=1 Tax=Bombilactobacillus apium TaxID=2675299 RepID=A0A850R4J9_9LACO|nr:YhbY family RNA-binding protein [Bombilactobacillus apium]NVY96901.1 YhbY family RNA-binding protein [Bombilactobacillus apium]
MLNNKQKRYLKQQAQSLNASFQIGKNGLNGAALQQLQAQLNVHELVKVSILQNSAALTSTVVAAVQDFDPRILLVQTIGRTLVFYKRASKISNRHLSLEVDAL